MFCLASDWIESGFHVYQVQSTTQNRRKFRQVARETCGESMEPPNDNLIMFGEISELKGKNSSSDYCLDILNLLVPGDGPLFFEGRSGEGGVGWGKYCQK